MYRTIANSNSSSLYQKHHHWGKRDEMMGELSVISEQLSGDGGDGVVET